EECRRDMGRGIDQGDRLEHPAHLVELADMDRRQRRGIPARAVVLPDDAGLLESADNITRDSAADAVIAGKLRFDDAPACEGGAGDNLRFHLTIDELPA